MVDESTQIDSLEQRLARLEDEAAIRRLLSGYGRAIDRNDPVLLAEIFTTDARIDYGPEVFQGRGEDFVPVVLGIQREMVRTQHLLGQSIIEISGLSAKAETYSQAVHILEREGQCLEFTTGSRYLDRLEKRAGNWQITARKVVIDWSHEHVADESLLTRIAGPPVGGRGSDDPSYGFL